MPSEEIDPLAIGRDPEKQRREKLQLEDQLAELPVGTWAALSLENQEVVGTGSTRAAAVESARKRGHNILNLVRVAAKSPLGLAS